MFSDDRESLPKQNAQACVHDNAFSLIIPLPKASLDDSQDQIYRIAFNIPGAKGAPPSRPDLPYLQSHFDAVQRFELTSDPAGAHWVCECSSRIVTAGIDVETSFPCSSWDTETAVEGEDPVRQLQEGVRAWCARCNRADAEHDIEQFAIAEWWRVGQGATEGQTKVEQRRLCVESSGTLADRFSGDGACKYCRAICEGLDTSGDDRVCISDESLGEHNRCASEGDTTAHHGLAGAQSQDYEECARTPCAKRAPSCCFTWNDCRNVH